MSIKPVVHYVGKPMFWGAKEHGAILTPVDHPDSENVTNLKPVRTSPVVNYDEKSGTIETRNTMYVPYHSDDKPW